MKKTKRVDWKRQSDKLHEEVQRREAEIGKLHVANAGMTRELEAAQKMEAHLAETINRLAASEKALSGRCAALGNELDQARNRSVDLEKQLAELKGYIARVNEDEAVRFREAHPSVERQVLTPEPPYRSFLDRFETAKKPDWAR